MTLFLQMFGVGLVTSIHCVAMCGGLVVACAVRSSSEEPLRRRAVPHLAYQTAKIASYALVAVVLAGVVALIGRAVDIQGFRNWFMVFAGVYMVLLGMSMTGQSRVLSYLIPRPPRFLVSALSEMRGAARGEEAVKSRPSLRAPLFLGALTGLMPCAPLIAAQAAAMSTGSPLQAAFAMTGFGLGTAPLMLAFGFVSSLASRAFQRRMHMVSAVAVVVFGLVIFDRGLMLIGSPVTFSTARTAFVSGVTRGAVPAGFHASQDGVVEVEVAIRDTEYFPRDVVVPAGRPVRLVVDRQEDIACSDQLAIPAAGVLADLAPNGVTRVGVPALEPGTYTLTCGMGMMSGSIVAVKTAPRKGIE